MRSIARAAALVTTAAVLALPAAAAGASFTVNDTADLHDAADNGLCQASNGKCTLRAAVEQANLLAGADSVSLPAGTFKLTLPPAAPLDVTQDLAIAGAGAGKTTIDGNDEADRGILGIPNATTALSLSNLTLTRGKAQFGSAVRSVSNAPLALTGVDVLDNTNPANAPGVGAIFILPATGGSTLTITRSRLNGNHVGGGTGGDGLGVVLQDSAGATLTIDRSELNGNTVGGGTNSSGRGVVYLIASASAAGTVKITDSSLSDNHVGGGATSPGVTSGVGTFLFTGGSGSSLSLTRSSIAGNTVGGGGTNASGIGGGVEFFTGAGKPGNMTVQNSTISGNTAGGGFTGAGGIGGGILFSGDTGKLSVTNSTLSGNTAGGGATGANGSGGAIAMGPNSTASLLNATLAGNRAGGGGGSASGGAIDIATNVTFKNTLLAGNLEAGAPGACDTAATTSGGHNIETGTSCGLTGPGDRNANPLLAPLASNLGPTLTMALPRNSPAVNAGDNAGAPATDQRGVKRPQGPAVDIGAFELDYTAPAISKLRASRRTFAVNTKGPAEVQASKKRKRKRARKGTSFSYSVTEPARVVFTIERRSTGRKVGKTCKRKTRKNRRRKRCNRYKSAGSFAQQAAQGANTKKFSGKIGKRKLRPGSYRLTLVGKDPSGNPSKASRLSFKVVRR